MARPKFKKPKFTSIRSFLEECISGRHTPGEVFWILDQIEAGMDLQKADQELAERFENMPVDDGSDPAYLRGYEAGFNACKAANDNAEPSAADNQKTEGNA